MSATDYLNNAQEWLAQQSQRTIDYQWEIQHHNQMHKAYETSWQVFLDLSNFQQQYNGQGKTICLFHTNRLTRAVGGIFKGIYISVDTYMIFLERGRELIAAQVVEKEMLLLLLIDIILVVWGCSVNMYIVPFFYIPIPLSQKP